MSPKQQMVSNRNSDKNQLKNNIRKKQKKEKGKKCCSLENKIGPWNVSMQKKKKKKPTNETFYPNSINPANNNKKTIKNFG